jgi:hypothetical protein
LDSHGECDFVGPARPKESIGLNVHSRDEAIVFKQAEQRILTIAGSQIRRDLLGLVWVAQSIEESLQPVVDVCTTKDRSGLLRAKHEDIDLCSKSQVALDEDCEAACSGPTQGATTIVAVDLLIYPVAVAT